VISPLLANLYLNEFDQAFHGKDGPYEFAKARLIRYADDFVVMARYMGRRIVEWIEGMLEKTLKLIVNREKTRIVKMRPEERACLNFLGYSLRYDKDLYGRDKKYLNVFPSDKSVERIKEKIRSLTIAKYKEPLKEVIQQINTVIRGWSNYYKYGYPRKTFRAINYFVIGRMSRFLRNRSQRSSNPRREGESLYACMKRLGLLAL
jgi:RNA-directed DNA polymerase